MAKRKKRVKFNGLPTYDSAQPLRATSTAQRTSKAQLATTGNPIIHPFTQRKNEISPLSCG